MPDLIQTANELKSVPDQWLQHELAQPSGAVPGYLVLAEAQRRSTLRSGAAQNQQQTSSVYEDVLRNLTAGAPAPGPPAPPGAAPPPSGLGQLANGSAPPPGNFQAPPKPMAEGGSVDDADTDQSGSYDDLINSAAQQHNVDPDLIRSVIQNESAGKRLAKSPKGAVGLMQLMPGTARDLGVDPTDPEQNIQGGTRLLRQLQDRYGGDLKLALAAYNAGPGAVERYGGVPPYKETQNYVNRVTGTLAKLKNDAVPSPVIQADAIPPPATLTPDDLAVTPPAPPDDLGGTPPALADAPVPVAPGVAAITASAPPVAPAPLPSPPAAPIVAPAQFNPGAFTGQPSDALQKEIARLHQQVDQSAKPNFWQSLADFGWGMAASPAHSLATQIGAGGMNMTRAQQERADQVRKQQLALLGVDVSLDDQVRNWQEKIATANRTAVSQAQQRQLTTFEGLKNAAGAIPGKSNESPGSGYRFVPNPTGGEYGLWLSPTTSQVTTEKLDYLKGLVNPATKQAYAVDDVIPYTLEQDIRKRMMDATQKDIEAQNKPPAPMTGDNRLIAISLGYDPDNLTKDQAAAVYAKKKPEIELTPDQVDFHARAYLQGVPLPNLGMGTSGARLRQQVLGRAADLAHGETLAASRAEGQSDAGSLKRLVPQLDAVQAFENTANANLDLMLNTAKPLIDSGSPWINKPLREVETAGFGDKELAAYRAARQVAVTEIAKVTNNPSLSGQLSDTARKEVMGLIPEEATLGQVYSVAKILKQDMANRRNALIEQRTEIIRRMGGGPTAAPGAPAAPVPAVPSVRTATDPKTGRKVQTSDGGKTWTWSDTGERIQ